MANASFGERRRHRGVVWSNASADDGVYLRAVLVRPTFTRLLDAAVEFGLLRLKAEWADLQLEPTREVRRAEAIVARIFANIEKGFDIANRTDDAADARSECPEGASVCPAKGEALEKLTIE